MNGKGFEKDDVVRIDKCDVCPDIVGKTAKIKGFNIEQGYDAVELNFGRGRPRMNRPGSLSIQDISLVEGSK